MKILVTGSDGFIGSNMLNYLTEKNISAYGWSRKPSIFNNIRSIEMENMDEVMNELNYLKPDVIIHCAGSADVGKSVQYPETDYVGNVTLTHNLLFAMHKLNLKNCRFIYLSSAAVYGNPKQLPITENADINPLSPYALRKEMCESICMYMHKNYDLNIKILRIFSAYGEGLKKQIFWDMYKKVTETGYLKMLGTGNESRDYINIQDLMNAIYLISMNAPKNELIYNVANGKETTIKDVVKLFALELGVKEDRISFSGVENEGNPLNWCADISKLKTLGYEQKVSLQEGIKNYIKWIERV